jgi:hyperosmotically inducible periplasmic protein
MGGGNQERYNIPRDRSIKWGPHIMMNSNSTSKVVIGIAVVAVFGVAASVFAVRAKHQSQLASTAPAPALAASTDQNATDAAPPAQSAAAQTPTDQTATASSAPPASSTPAAVPPANVAGTPASDESKPAKSKTSDRADRHVARTRNSGDAAGTRVASAASSNTSAADASASNSSDSMKSDSDTTSSAPAGATADSQQAPAQTTQEAALSAVPAATSNDPSTSDSQITANVKSEIATAAPNSNVNVTTTNGVVALAGSVPSQAAGDQARQAAQRVAGVKHVDASGLVISNQ